MLLIRWGYLPNEVRLPLRPLLVKYLFLVPGWCRALDVRYRQDHEGGPTVQASSDALPEYREGSLIIHAGWLDSNPNTRRASVIHELIHIPAAPPAKQHEAMIERLFEDGAAPKFKATVEEDWLNALEGMVQDLTFAILMIPEEHLPTVAFREEEDEHPRLDSAPAA